MIALYEETVNAKYKIEETDSANYKIYVPLSVFRTKGARICLTTTNLSLRTALRH